MRRFPQIGRLCDPLVEVRMFRLSAPGTFFRVSGVAMLLFVAAIGAQGASYKVLYSFNATNANPSSGLITDSQGNSYGATSAGGYNGAGTVYELSPTTGYHLLFKFGKTAAGGAYPLGNLTLDSAGNLYGTTLAGGLERNCCGVVFELSPSSNGGLWTETVLYTFCGDRKRGCPDGEEPAGGVIFDASGNLYGTTEGGGSHGTVFELSPNSGGWTETVLYDFGTTNDGLGIPACALVFDSTGNLYGTTERGGTALGGTVFELSPAGATWTETILYQFGSVNNDGAEPLAGVVFGPVGNLYGTTQKGGDPSCSQGVGCGTVFELTPTVGGSWTEKILHSFDGTDGNLSQAAVVLDASGSVYGTAFVGGTRDCNNTLGCGTVFKLTQGIGGVWAESVYRFQNESSGSNPMAPLTLDSSGNVYGTTTTGGPRGGGVAFKITQ